MWQLRETTLGLPFIYIKAAMSKQGKVNVALGQTKTTMSGFHREGRDDHKLSGLNMLPFAIPWLISLHQNDSLLTGTLRVMSLSHIQRDRCWGDRKWRANVESHLLAALRGHLSEQGGEEAGVLEQNAAHDPEVGGHHHGISLCNTHTYREMWIDNYSCGCRDITMHKCFYIKQRSLSMIKVKGDRLADTAESLKGCLWHITEMNDQ